MTARLSHVIWCLLVALTLTPSVDAAPPRETKHVLVLYPAGFNWQIRTRFAMAFADAIRATDTVRIDVAEETIEPPRFPGAEQSSYITRYLAGKYAGRTFDVIVAQGATAFGFAQDNRALFGHPPIVTSVAPNARVSPADGIVGLEGSMWIDETIQLAVALRPDACCIAVIDGIRNNPGSMEAEVRRQWNARPRSVSLTYLRDLPLDDLLERVKALPDRAVLFYIRQVMRTPSEDVDRTEALEQILSVARVPVLSHLEEYVGLGILGGSVWRVDEDARRMADMTMRLAAGANPRDIPTQRSASGPMLDWRQLQRWGIPDTRVPVGAAVVHRQTSVFEEYRGYIIGGVTLVAAQLALLSGLLLQRARRRRAERDVQQSREELARLTRISAIGELAASLAHELNQPLSAILSNARAATNLLAAQHQPPSEVDEILHDIMEDDKRASEVIKRMRELVGKQSTVRAPVDVHETVDSVVKLLTSDAIIRQVPITLELAHDGVIVTADRVQLQQVILNLLLNALEATSASADAERRITVSTTMSDSHTAHLVVRDDGPGLAPGAEQQVFEPFFTTKLSGMGMGLAVAKSIVESHHGRIWAEPSARGAEFHVTLPRQNAAGAAARRSA
jgi:signal transduction histidine kinase